MPREPIRLIRTSIWGNVDALAAEAIAADLDELLLPYRYDILSFDHIVLPSLREHIERIGITLYVNE